MATQNITGPIIAMCCVCDQVAEDGSQPQSQWKTLDAYSRDHHMAALDYQLSHTYCPACYQDQARAWKLPPVDRRAA
jgi:hypothetical protein